MNDLVFLTKVDPRFHNFNCFGHQEILIMKRVQKTLQKMIEKAAAQLRFVHQSVR